MRSAVAASSIMASDELVIRNLTSNTITVEKYEIHDRVGHIHGDGRISHATRNVTSLFGHHRDPTLDCRVSESIPLYLQSWETGQASVPKADLPNQILCIFFQIRDESYQVNIIHKKIHTQYLMSSEGNPDPPCKHITVYNPERHHLTIAYRDSYKSWMRSLRDDVLLSSVSIPGTHNSPTYHKALPSVRCQCVPVRKQLEKGIRFLDIRVQPEHPKTRSTDAMTLVHGVFPISLTGPRHFRPLINEVFQFLEENPSETVIVSVKREGRGRSTDEDLSIIMHDHYATDLSKWFTAPRVPYLGEARGKIVLVRRFHLDEQLTHEWGGQGWGINADTWADNSPNSLCPSGDLCIQDFYEVLDTENIGRKIQYSIEHLRRAAQCVSSASSKEAIAKQPFYINFLTASNFWKMGCWPDKIAAKLNPAIVEYLCLEHNRTRDGIMSGGDGSTGVVVCDWVGHQGDWDIVRCIIGMNARLEKRP